jgi:NAD(P)-dependent dehydrogenase (short-subunit alcohol dehydrogenase family)
MKAFTDSVSASLRQSATMDHGGSAGHSFRSFRRPGGAAHATWQEGKFVANAGVVDPVSLTESTPETFDKHFNLKARGAYFTVQKALPLLADKASIILSGSAAWQMGVPDFGPYSATKAALVSFVRTWTAELASRGIRANVISPGPTETPTLWVLMMTAIGV